MSSVTTRVRTSSYRASSTSESPRPWPPPSRRPHASRVSRSDSRHVSAGGEGPMVDRRVLVADLAVKAATVGVLLFALTHQDWERFSDKAMVGRAIVYPMALAIVPVVWWIARRRGSTAPYPALADLLFSMPWLIDVLGNAANTFDRIGWFDDAAHFVNWAFLSAALAVVLPIRLGIAARIGLCS